SSRVDSAGRDRVDGDAPGPELTSEGLRPADHTRSYGVGEHEVVDGLAHGARLDVDHAPAAAALEVRSAEVRQPDRREEQQLDRRLDGCRVEVEGRAARRAAAVVHEDTDAAEGLECALDEALELARVRQLAADGERADPLGLPRENVAAAR